MISLVVPCGFKDAPLVARTQNGDVSAFGILVRKHQMRIARLIGRILPEQRDKEKPKVHCTFGFFLIDQCETFINLLMH